MLKTIDFQYDLPQSLIAQHPLEQRDQSRLLKVSKDPSQPFENQLFTDIENLLMPGDLLVFNDTRVIPARLFCRRPTGGAIELLFTQRIDSHTWYAIGKPMRRLRPNGTLLVGERGETVLTISDGLTQDSRVISLKNSELYASIDALLESVGVIPLPPYIEREAQECDKAQYQTVYARNPGAVAAPTAGLHFTSELIQRIKNKGVTTCYVTLHVGIGTFRPVTEENPSDHPMHYERYLLENQVVESIKATRSRGGRVIAVGTTVVRVLESCCKTGILRAGEGETNLFIFPGYRFGVVDGLVTNFHLPGSTLLMLVSALGGHERIMSAYGYAVEQRYRFFSYGDAMIVL